MNRINPRISIERRCYLSSWYTVTRVTSALHNATNFVAQVKAGFVRNSRPKWLAQSMWRILSGFFLLFLFCFVSLFLVFGVEDCDPFSIVRYLLVCTVSTFNQSADNDEWWRVWYGRCRVAGDLARRVNGSYIFWFHFVTLFTLYLLILLHSWSIAEPFPDVVI